MRTSTLHALTAVSVIASAVAVGSHFVSGAGEGEESVFVPITPCRLVDSRPGDVNVGPASTPIGPDETVTFNAHDGADDDSLCAIPASATAISANVVAIAPTARSYLALFPSDADNPGTANLNVVAGQPPTPNAAVVPLSDDGGFDVYNAFGEVGVVIDVAGFFRPSSRVGASGPQGETGDAGPRGPSAWDDIPSGQTVTGSVLWTDSIGTAAQLFNISVAFPGKANPGISSNGDVSFAPDAFDGTIDDDPACTGTAAEPTAPPGEVCIYATAVDFVYGLSGQFNAIDGGDGFVIRGRALGDGTPYRALSFAWAYTAP